MHGTDGRDGRDGRDAAAGGAGRTRRPREQRLARWLLRAVLTDPGRLPEILTTFASRRLGPAAARTVARIRAEHPDAGPAELQALVVARGRRVVVVEGAFVGGPFIVLVPFAFCAALLAQLRMALELAAVAGHDATAPDRTAELLVIQGAHPDVRTARAALAAVAPCRPAGQGHPVGAPPGTPHLKRRRGRIPPRSIRPPDEVRGGANASPARITALIATVVRMAYLLGLLGPRTPTGRLVRAGRWALVLGVFALGTIAPLVWLPYLAYSYHQSTGQLAARTIAFHRSAPPGQSARAADPPAADLPTRADPGMIAAALRTLSSLLLPAAAIGLVLVAAVEDSRWPVLAVVVTLVSTAIGTVWYLRNRWGPRG
ncbi:hypothetical protein LG634_22165 [Streptomyces bambusae]|uniref:hypothetical protein n=1 Tax=Streptomyces bambusae TaxID=1550616 RepID=UPI001CFC4F19|nr:hypothetical protein [Streptomyces bambusae]MCB5167522.1 hypothetical protein [Streptomyces bambusae]